MSSTEVMTSESKSHEKTPNSAVFWIGALLGWAIMFWGVRGLLDDSRLTDPGHTGRWAIMLLILHDAILAPATVAVAWVVGKVAPGRFAWPVRAGIAATVFLTFFSLPLVRGYGANAANPTIYSLDYGANLLWSIVAVWLAVGAWVGYLLFRRQEANS